MTINIGRCQLQSNPTAIDVAGQTVTITVNVNPTTAGDANHWNALRQQFNGLVGNLDEPVVPVTWTVDSQYDGYYRVVSAQLPSWNAMHLRKYTPSATIVLERLLAYGNAAIEVSVHQVAVRTNSVSVATMAPVVAFTLPATVAEDDLRNLSSLTSVSRVAGTPAGAVEGTMSVKTKTAAVTVATTFQTVTPPSTAYVGAAMVEFSYGGTWYPVIGRCVPLNTVWRISNGLVRLTSANGATSGKFEVFNGSNAWESVNVTHATNTSTPAAITAVGIGLGTGSAQPSVSVVYCSPERVSVKCKNASVEMTYTVMRGAMLITAGWSTTTGSTATYGAGFTTGPIASTAVGAWGLRTTSNDANGNRLVFGIAPTSGAVRTDTTNGWINNGTAATSGGICFGVELDGSTAISGNAAADIGNQYFGAVAWSQRMVGSR